MQNVDVRVPPTRLSPELRKAATSERGQLLILKIAKARIHDMYSGLLYVLNLFTSRANQGKDIDLLKILRT